MRLLFLVFLFLSQLALAQPALLRGIVTDQTGQPVPAALIRIGNQQISSSATGEFHLPFQDGDVRIQVQHVAYYLLDTLIKEEEMLPFLRLPLQLRSRILEEVAVESHLDIEKEKARDEAGLITLEPEVARQIPTVSGDISNILATLPGVIQNNELSTSYAVRGGNFDENLVYVNDIPVYRPILVRSGRQEGLSFVNPQLVESLSFSAGGWQARYGDRLSSVLAVRYKKPDSLEAGGNISLLGGAAYVGGKSKNIPLTYLAGFRHKNTQYLLNTLDTEGEYLPRFSDFQGFFTYQPGKKSELGLLLSYARNRYLLEPASRTTSFGTLQQAFELNVGLDGQELMQYDLGQQALYYRLRPNDQHESTLILSYVKTKEREYVDLISQYRLCNVDLDPNSNTFQECLQTLGAGNGYTNIRNRLDGDMYTLQWRHRWQPGKGQRYEAGLQLDQEEFSDYLQEWTYADSAGYALVNFGNSLQNEISLTARRAQGYLQGTTYLAEGRHSFTYGLRTHYYSVNEEWLLSPRVQYAYRPLRLSDLVLTASAGLYAQPPIYRELRNRKGELNKEVLAQKSFHALIGADLNFRMWGRVFNLVNEWYYKYLWDVNTYELENNRIRYFADNTTSAYAWGSDVRISGEFIPNAESWFSLGVLSTREDLANDRRGYIRRPSDQRLNFGVFLQDHLPNDPSVRVFLRGLYSSGLPFGPPGRVEDRTLITSRAYRRVDIGFTKQLDSFLKNTFFNKAAIGLEVLNLLGNNNVISYTWVNDFAANQYAVPNTLSSRFFNLKLVFEH